MALVDRHIAAWAVMLLGLIPGFMEHKEGTGRLGSCPIRSLGGQGVRAARMGRHGYVWELVSITDGLLDKAIE